MGADHSFTVVAGEDLQPDREAIDEAISAARTGDVVCVAGKGHETYQIFADRTIHFDDREVARAVLEGFGYGKA